MSMRDVVRRNRPRVWSSSRRSLMERCPRAWALRYGHRRGRSGNAGRMLSMVSDWRSPWDLMLRSLRSLIIERLEACAIGIRWSDSDIELKMRDKINDMIDEQNDALRLVEKRIGSNSELRASQERAKIDDLVAVGSHRFRRLMLMEPLHSIIRGKITDWELVGRLNSVRHQGKDLYIAPDLIWRIGRVRFMLRFVMQGGREMTEHARMEHSSMIAWLSRDFTGEEEKASKVVIEIIDWHRGRWHRKSFEPNDDEVELAMTMIEYDLVAMDELYQRLGPLTDLSMMPLASSKEVCRGCGHVDSCPGGENLERAKIEQSVIEMARCRTS